MKMHPSDVMLESLVADLAGLDPSYQRLLAHLAGCGGCRGRLAALLGRASPCPEPAARVLRWALPAAYGEVIERSVRRSERHRAALDRECEGA